MLACINARLHVCVSVYIFTVLIPCVCEKNHCTQIFMSKTVLSSCSWDLVAPFGLVWFPILPTHIMIFFEGGRNWCGSLHIFCYEIISCSKCTALPLSKPLCWNCITGKGIFSSSCLIGLGIKGMQFQVKDKGRKEVFLSWRLSLTETLLRLQQLNTTMSTQKKKSRNCEKNQSLKGRWAMSEKILKNDITILVDSTNHE